MADLSERLQALSPEKRLLLEYKLKQSRVPSSSGLKIKPSPRQSGMPAPLSFSQQRLWFLHQLEPDSPRYNTCACVRLIGPLNLPALHQAFNEIIRRHEVLRLTFGLVDGAPVAFPHEDLEFALPLTDLQSVTADERDAQSLKLATDEIRQPFDLARGPVIRGLLLRLQPEECVLTLTLHHIVSDRWSIDVLMRELGLLYAAFAQRRPSPLPPLPVQYADFAGWQRQRLAGEVCERDLLYWKEQLKDCPQQLELPADYPRSTAAASSSKGDRVTRELPADLMKRLVALSQQEEVTLFMLMLAAFKVLLARYTGEDDLVIGSPISNRSQPEIQSLIGFFLNTLVLRTDLSGDPTFRAALRRVRNVCLDAYAHQELPFERLVEELNPQRSRAANPLFQVMFTLNESHDPISGRQLLNQTLASSNLRLQPIKVETGAVQADLLLHIENQPHGATCALDYRTDLFAAERMERLLRHYQQLLESLAAAPAQPISRLSLLDSHERAQLLVEWNETARPYPRQQHLASLLSRLAQSQPTAVALQDGSTSVSYQELERRSNQLARYLRRQGGVGSEQVVAVMGERSAEMVISLLAVLKAGAAYLPLDEGYPAERLRYMLEESRVEVIVRVGKSRGAATAKGGAEEAADASAPGGWRGREVWVQEERAQIERESGEGWEYGVGGDELAYVIYTSGSTGRPKGVCVTHRAICRLLCNTNYAQLQSTDRIAHLSNPSFDAATFEIWGALLAGAKLVVISREVALAAAELTAAIREHEINVMFLTTALFNQVAQLEPAAFNQVRDLLFGGEAVEPRWARAVMQAGGPARLLHVYGPTESTTFTTWHPVSVVKPEAQTIPIGRPLANTEVYLFDRHLQPVPVGVVGELFIGGDGLARGYYARPELTAEKFVPNPLKTGHGERLYRTGDLCRYLPDGNIEFIGRRDHQVKIRGFRIEPDEIAFVLGQHQDLLEAIVEVRTDAAGDKRLIAYLVPQPGVHPDLTNLREHLKNHLPQYMLPSAYVVLDKLPLTPNGKIDRRALPDPQPVATPNEAEFVAPRTAIEEILVNTCADLLKLERVSVTSNFFMLGGHSLLATQLIARVHKIFDLKLPLRVLYEAENWSTLAATITELTAQQQGVGQSLQGLSEAVPDPAHRFEPFPLTDVQQAYWLGRTNVFELGEVSAHGYLELDAHHLDLPRLERALQHLIERHEMLRAIFLPDGRQQALAMTPSFSLDTQDLRELSEQAKDSCLQKIRDELSHQVLPCDQWPLFKITASILEPDLARLHISTDALIGDAWSWQILSKEIDQLYADPSAELPPLTLTFRDYVLAEQALRKTEAYSRALSYWRARVPDFPTAPDLPVVQKARQLKKVEFKRRAAQLAPALWEKLKARALQEGLTSSGLILAIFSEVLAAWSRTERFALNLTLFNRLPLHPDVNLIVGDFTSLILLAIEPRAEDSFILRARRIQRQLFEDLDQRFVSGVQVLRDLTRARGGTGAVTMPVVFTSLLNLTSPVKRQSQIQARLVYSISQTPQVWLDHQVYEQEDALHFSWDAVEELFPAGMLDDMFESFVGMLTGLAQQETWWEQSRFELLPPEQLERRAEINATEAPQSDELLHTLFRKRAEQQPRHPAIIAPGKTLTYQELGRLSNGLARQLRQAGAVPNQLVAIFMEKGWEQVVGALSILAAGAAYLPIDPELPEERIRYLLDNGDVRLALTQSWLAGRLKAIDGLVCWPVDEQQPDSESEPSPPCVQLATDLAYVIYTSGSTGQPKGVMIDHRGAVNTILDINQRFQVGPTDRILALSKLSFDLSVYDIFGALAAGATIVMPEASIVPDPGEWAAILNEQQVTIWNSVPALMSLLAQHVSERQQVISPSLRLALLSGDWIPVTLPESLRQLLPQLQLISLGGATEASIWSIFHPIQETDPSWTSIPYGRPLLNQQMHVLDRQLSPCPDWVPGEIYIGGIGVALGYWRDEEKSREKFIVHPQTGQRLYRTGDLGRYWPSGVMEFLGREDFQVKVQGYRIELGEIEAALAQHPQVKENVVIAWGDAASQRRLVAYLVPDEGATLTANEARDYLRAHLPAYMLPSQFIFLAALPLTPNGKVDRRALPEPDAAQCDERVAETSGTLSPDEELLGHIWADVLQVSQVGVDEDFFTLGGQSMMATQVVAQIREVWGVDLPLRRLFEQPTVRRLAREIEKARQQQRGPEAPLISQPRQDDSPLSFAQQRLWFLDQLIPGLPIYNMPFAARLRGTLQVEALQRSLCEIVKRHETLRTTFEEREGAAAQVIHPAQDVELIRKDLQHLAQAEWETDARAIAASDAGQPFDLKRGPLFRAALLKLSPTEHVLLVTLHHIVADGWSLGRLVKELSVLYQAFLNDEPSPLSPLPVQYADYAIWQRQWLQGEVYERQLAYWREHLKDAPPLHQLPTDKPRPAAQSFRGAHQSIAFTPELSEQLRALSRQQSSTLFMTLLAIFKTLLYRMSGQPDIVIGTPVANRTRPEVSELIGFFANTLILRSQLKRSQLFTELLREVRETALDAYAHQDFPFEKLVEELNPERGLSHMPVFQIMFVLQNAPLEPVQLPDLTLQAVESETRTVHFDLTLRLWEEAQAIRGQIEYNTDIFEPETIARLASYFQTLAENLAANPAQPVGTVALISQAERRQLLSEWNNYSPLSRPASFAHEMIAQQAQLAPDRIAVQVGGDSLTYRELNERANQLAHYLRRSAVGPDDCVAICASRSLNFAIAILGVLKAGAAWVPLDPTYPAERLSFILQDTRAEILLAEKSAPEELTAQAARVVYLDSDWPGISRCSTGQPDATVAPEHLAYVIYTSGSTGVPKGAMMTHGNLRHYVGALSLALGLTPEDVYLHTASFGFSSSVRQLIMPLTLGARVVLSQPEQLGDPLKLFALVKRERITVVDIVPSYWQACWRELSALSTDESQDLRANDLRLLLSASEALPTELTNRWKQLWGRQTSLINMLGQTETTGIVATHPLAAQESGSLVPVGRPLAETAIYLLDEDCQPVPVGATGEVHISGAGLGRGYLGQPALTAAAFIPDPFSPRPGARMLKTGDLARHRADGTIEFMQRKDYQLKVRGFRVEPGEVESVIRSHPSVQDAVVLAQIDAAGYQGIVAYLLSREAPAEPGVEIRAYVKEKLPDYMVPQAFYALDKFPLTPTGKVDRRALTAMANQSLRLTTEMILPRTPVEQRLASIWAEALGLERVGLYDNFFVLGGHSLLATQVISRIRDAFAVDVPLRVMFERPTVADLSQTIQEQQLSQQPVQLPPITPVSRDGQLPLSFAQQRLWFMHQFEPESPTYSIPAVIRLKGQLDIPALQRSFDLLRQRHEVLRATFKLVAGQPAQEIAPFAPAELERLDLYGSEPGGTEDEIRRLLEDEIKKPFDLSKGPLLRTLLVTLQPDQHILLLVFHHIVSDGWSVGVLIRDMMTIYEGLTGGGPFKLPELPVQYADYAVWQRGWLQGETRQRYLQYWTDKLAGAPPALDLPTDYQRPPAQTFRGATHTLRLPVELKQAVQALARKTGSTDFMVLLAAFQVLLHHYTGQTDISIGTPIAGRSRSELEGLIGCFINTLVLRSQISEAMPFDAVLKSVKETVLEAYEHQELPFEYLVEQLQPQRLLNRNPLFQVMFILQNAPLPRLTLKRLEVEQMNLTSGTSKFDLTMSVRDIKDGYLVSLEYAEDLYAAERMERLLRHYQQLLAAITATPSQPINHLSLLAAGERHQLLVEWNDTARPYPRQQHLASLLAQQAQAQPEAIAIVDGSTTMSYRQLERRSNQLARCLRQQGVGRGQVVGVLAERSAEMVITMLGVLKAGAAYLPLDEEYPWQRLRHMLEESEAELVLRVGGKEGRARGAGEDEGLWGWSGRVVRVEEEREAIERESGDELKLGEGGDDLAYVLYTSGSTGRPKGVAIRHRSVVALCYWAREVFGLDALSGVLASTSICFDLSVFEIFVPLCWGGTVIMAANALELPSLPAKNQVTLINTVPSAMTELLRLNAIPASAITFNLAGEALKKPLVERLYELAQTKAVYNLYGPSEDTTYSTFALIERETGDEPTIGRPISGTQVYLLNTAFQPVPLGAYGELYLSGEGLARGYFRRPDLTAERFLPNPFSPGPGERMYRTGDLARYLPDGRIHFAGRADHQVKVRGFRIELGEIEACSLEHQAVRESIAIVHDYGPEDQRLVAYVVPADGQHDCGAQLREHLRQRLPEYMVPWRIVVLDSLPLSPNGKIARHRLPAPDASRERLEREYVAPQTATQALLAEIWSQLLQVEQVGLKDSFFELGGHSLLAIQMIARVKETLGITLPVKVVFEHATIEELSKTVHLLAWAAAQQAPISELAANEIEGEL